MKTLTLNDLLIEELHSETESTFQIVILGETVNGNRHKIKLNCTSADLDCLAGHMWEHINTAQRWLDITKKAMRGE